MNHLERLDELKSMLIAEADCYRRMLEACRIHRRALISSHVSDVESTLRQELQAMEACNQASVARHRQTQVLAGEIGLDSPCSTGDVLSLLAPMEKAMLQEPYDQMRDLCARLAEENDQNRKLSEHRMDLIQGDFISMQKLVCRAAGRSQVEGEALEGSLLSIKV